MLHFYHTDFICRDVSSCYQHNSEIIMGTVDDHDYLYFSEDIPSFSMRKASFMPEREHPTNEQDAEAVKPWKKYCKNRITSISGFDSDCGDNKCLISYTTNEPVSGRTKLTMRLLYEMITVIEATVVSPRKHRWSFCKRHLLQLHLLVLQHDAYDPMSTTCSRIRAIVSGRKVGNPSSGR